MGLYTKAELTKKTKPELLELAETHSLDYDEDATVGDLRALLIEVEEAEEEEVDDAEEVDDSEEEEEDDELPEVDEEEVDEVVEVKKTTTKKTKYTESGADGDGNKLLGAKEVATQLGTDAKTLRQFFRSGKSTFNAVGAGGRYEFSETAVPKIKEEFQAWQANKPGRGRGAATEGGAKKTRSRGKAAPKPEETIEEIEEIEELEELDDLEEDLELED